MTGSALVVLGALAAAAGAVVAVTAVRHPAARRLGVRSAMRRPTETALVTLGALLGTAIITGSLVVGDALESSLQAGAFTQLGPVDETVTAPGPDALPALREALSGLEQRAQVDGVAFGWRSRGTAAARVEGDDPAVQPDVLLLEVDFDEARELGDDPAATGLDAASTPADGAVAISADLAQQLHVGAGDEVTVFAYGRSPSFEVASVLPQVGLAGYSTGLGARSFNVFLPPGTLEQLAATGETPPASPPTSLAFVSNQGGVLTGAAHSDQVTSLIEQRIATLPAVEVTASKQELLETADEVGAYLQELFLGIGAFAVVAGILLLVNVFVMLAQERRTQLGIMRAVGMQRTELVRAFFLEGSIYAAVAAVVGAVAGIGVGAAIIELARGLSAAPGGFTPDLRFAADASSVVGGLLVGLFISLVTILATSVRISRLNIIRAIRELPEPPRPRRPVLRVVVGLLATSLGGAATVAALAAEGGVGLFVGPAALAGGLVALLGPVIGRRRAVTVLGVLVVVWGVLVPTVLPDAFRNADVVVFVVQGLVITGAAVIVLARNQDSVGRLVRRMAGGSGSVVARLGLAYPLARPFRTTMTLAMYALIVFTLVLVSLLGQVIGAQPDVFADAESGGYDLLVTSNASDPLPADAVRDMDGVELVSPLRHAAFNVEFRLPGGEDFRRWFASGYDRQLLRTRPPALDRWLPSLPDEETVWEHVLDDPSTMILDAEFLQQAGSNELVQLGDTVDVRDPLTGERDERQLVGITKGGLAFSGAFMSEDSLVAILGPKVPANRLYVAVDEQANPQRIATTLQQQHIDHGVEARSFRAIVTERQQQNRQFMRILQGYLMLGLLVGIAGLGVVMVRAVRERRQQIGVLRSIGVQPGTVGRSFMLEAAFIALQGIIIGTVLGGATAYQLVSNAAAFGGLEVRFQIPWIEIAILLGMTLLASIAAAAWPARRASRIRPAVALRTVE
ncbi:MAG: ABC transporter permease [Actinomycetota bacterium]|nr:ABC transporter permease [Actinomycetota bacterium]